MSSIRWIDFAVIVLYMAAILAIGLRFSRRQTSTERYFTAKRSIPGWVTGLSLLATLISSVTFIAYPGSAYAGDWSNLVPGLMVVLVIVLVGRIIIPFYRHVVGVSVYEYFGKRFGYPARVYSSIAYACGHFSKMGFVFYLLALTVSSMTGWSTGASHRAGGNRNYPVHAGRRNRGGDLGGCDSGIRDLGGHCNLPGLFAFSAGRRTRGDARSRLEQPQDQPGQLAPDFSKPTVIVLAIYGFFYYLQRYTADQTVGAALPGREIGSRGMARYRPRYAVMHSGVELFMLIGTLCWAFYKTGGGTLPAYVQKADPGVSVFHYYSHSAGRRGFVPGSAIRRGDGESVVRLQQPGGDFCRRLLPACSSRPHPTSQRLRVAKIVVAFAGMLCIAVATVLARSHGSALSLWYTVSAIVAGGLVGLFLLAFLMPRASGTAANIGIVASLVFTAYATLTLGGGKIWDLGRFNFPLHDYMIGVIGHLILFGVGYAASFVFPNRSGAQSRVDHMGTSPCAEVKIYA